jgi:phosphoribosylformylglycinamidine cyclo-ligase
MAHITGGGLIANFKRTLPSKTKFDLDIRKLPIEYNFIKKYTSMTNEEISEVFNCGFGFTIVVDKKTAPQFIKRRNFKIIGSII